MATLYRHTQIGELMRWSMWLGAFALLAGGLACGNVYTRLIMTSLALLVGAVGWVFSSLTVEVSAGELNWFFGPGVWRNRVARVEIVSAASVENKWWWGFCVHCTPRGWLYNVAGLAGVEIALRDGGMFRIGSDEAAVLSAALNQ